MKCPYCGHRMLKDEDSGMKICWSCEAKHSKTKRTAKRAKQKELLKNLELLVNNVFK